MAKTTCRGIRTSTFLNIAAHAGLRVQHQLLLIDLTSWTILKEMHQSDSTLKLSSTVRLVALATVETPELCTSGLMTTVLFTHPVSNTLLTTCKDVNALQLTSAVTAPGHHLDPIKTALMDVSQLNRMSSTT